MRMVSDSSGTRKGERKVPRANERQSAARCLASLHSGIQSNGKRGKRSEVPAAIAGHACLYGVRWSVSESTYSAKQPKTKDMARNERVTMEW